MPEPQEEVAAASPVVPLLFDDLLAVLAPRISMFLISRASKEIYAPFPSNLLNSLVLGGWKGLGWERVVAMRPNKVGKKYGYSPHQLFQKAQWCAAGIVVRSGGACYTQVFVRGGPL